MTEPIDRLTNELREATRDPRVDWDAVDSRLFARLRDEARVADAAARAETKRGWTWLVASAGLAAAAIAAVVVGGAGRVAPLDDARATGARAAMATHESRAAVVAAIEPGAVLLVDGALAAKDARVAEGARIEARGGRARIVAEGSATFVVNAATNARVAHAGSTLVVALESGAVEAEVVKHGAEPARDDTFAVDVRGSRVAARGTHLRVATEGDRVVVDLNEGILAIGDAPRSGSVVGALVAAPAHAEFSPADVKRTLRVDHAAGAVRPAIAFAIEEGVALPGATNAPAPSSASSTSAASASESTLPLAPAPSHEHASTSPAVAVSARPESTIAAAVEGCLAARKPGDGVNLSVTTTLLLTVNDEGAVQMARFDPPIAPEAQSCATGVIYKTRFAHGGDVAIPIAFRNP